MSGVENDVIPYGLVMGDRARLAGLNLVGLERRGFSQDDIRALRGAYRTLFGSDGTFSERLQRVGTEFGSSPVVETMLGFIQSRDKRALCQPRQENGA
jgi:UDP-N-acetylglucosamine acyltransferase